MAFVDNRASVRVKVYDPRKDGYLNKQPYRLDYDFFSPEEEWDTYNCEIIEDIGALTLRHVPLDVAMKRDEWTFYGDDTDNWLNVKPSSNQQNWLHQPSPGRAYWAEKSPEKTLNDFDSISMMFYPGEASRMITNLSSNYEQLQEDPTATAIGLTHPYPCVFWDVFDGNGEGLNFYRWMVPLGQGGKPWLGYFNYRTEIVNNFLIIKEFEETPMFGEMNAITLRRIYGDYFVLNWEQSGTREVLYLPEYPTRNKIRFGGAWVECAFNIGRCAYPSSGYALGKKKIIAYGDVSATPDRTTIDYEDDDDTDVDVSLSAQAREAGGDEYPLLTLTTSDELKTPVVFRATWEYDAEFGDTAGLDTPVIDSTSTHKGMIYETTWEQGDDYRASSAGLTIKNKNDIIERDDIAINAIASVEVKHGSGSWITQYYGRVNSIGERKSPDESAGTIQYLSVGMYGEDGRLGHHESVHRLGSLAGMSLRKAVGLILGQCGIPTSRICWFSSGAWKNHDTLEDDDLPTIQWSSDIVGELRFKPSTSAIEAMDRITSITGWDWGYNSGPGSPGGAANLGDICLWVSKAHQYGSNVVTDTFEEGDANNPILDYDYIRDGSTINYVEIHGVDLITGEPAISIAQSTNSQSVGTSLYFIGDRSERVEVQADNPQPWNIAQHYLQEGLIQGRKLSLSSLGNDAIRPGSVVAVDLDSDGSYKYFVVKKMKNEVDDKRNYYTDYGMEEVVVG